MNGDWAGGSRDDKVINALIEVSGDGEKQLHVVDDPRASNTCPDSSNRTITLRRRCKSMPTNCRPAYSDIRGLLSSSDVRTLPASAGAARGAEAPLLHRIRGTSHCPDTPHPTTQTSA